MKSLSVDRSHDRNARRIVAGECADAGRRRRHDLRARAQCRQGAAELAAAPRQLSGPPVLGAQGDQHRHGQEPEGRVHGRARRLRGRRHPLQVRRSRSHPDRRGRRHVRAGRLGHGLCDRRLQRQARAPSAGSSIPPPTRPGPATWPAAASTTAAWRCGRTRSSRSRSTAGMFALNKATGEKVWERKIADPAIGETLTLAPLVVRDVAIVGAAGGEFGIRGFIDGTDLNTGKQLWRTYTIPGAGEPGNETWKDGQERWQHGGGSLWETAHLRPRHRHDLPGHRQCRARLRSAVPARATTNGRRACWRSIRPTARSSGASSTPPTTRTTSTKSPSTRSSTPRSTARTASSWCTPRATASIYALDRTNGSFVAGKQYVDELNWTPGLDPKTGRPLNYDPDQGRAGIRPRQPRLARQAAGRQALPVALSAARTGSRRPTIPSSTCSIFPPIEGCNTLVHRGAEGLRGPGRHR